MKNSLFLIIFLFLSLAFQSLAQIVDTSKFSNPLLKEGQCHTMADTKIYLKDIVSGATDSATIKNIGTEKINSALSNSVMSNSSLSISSSDKANPSGINDESYFFCKLKCQLKNNFHFVWITQKDKNENLKNMQGFVCMGLNITKVQATPTLEITTTVAQPFVAVNTKSIELRNYLKQINYIIPETLQNNYLTLFFDTINVVAKSYQRSGHPELTKAAEALYQIKNTDLSDKNNSLNLRIQELASQNWTLQIPKSESIKSNNLFDRFLIENARFIEFLATP